MVDARRARDTRLDHEQGGHCEGHDLYLFSPFPRNEATVSILRNKLTSEDALEIRDALAKTAEIARRSQPREAPCVAKVDRVFDSEDLRTTLMRACP